MTRAFYSWPIIKNVAGDIFYLPATDILVNFIGTLMQYLVDNAI